MLRSFNEYKGMEASGRTLAALLQAFGQFKALASKYLLEEGVGQKGPEGVVVVDPSAWYPLDAYLRALTRFSQEMGDSVVHQIGMSIPKHVQWPPNITDIKTFTLAMDMGYHMSHRRHGQVMGDPATGRIMEGIGHYLARSRPDGFMEIEADNPYPCAFDRGVLFGAMRVLNVVGAIIHDESHPCRKRGSKACVYVVKG
jgi:hypothetical protein